MKLTDEQFDALQSCIRHHGFQYFMAMVDDIVSNIQGNVLSVPLDKDPNKAQLQLYVERMKAEGAIALKSSITVKVKDIKEKR